MEKIVVGVIVVIAALTLINRLRSTLKGGGCGGGCSNCPSASKCISFSSEEDPKP